MAEDKVIPLDSIGPITSSKGDAPSVIPLDTIKPPDEPTPSKLTPNDQAAIHKENQYHAGLQFTSPDIETHRKNYIGEATLNDGGQAFIVGKDGKWTPTHSSKHVVLRDPEDGKYKVYGRSEETDEGPVRGRTLGLGRWFMENFATGAPAIAKGLSTAGQVAKSAQRLGEATGVGDKPPMWSLASPREGETRALGFNLGGGTPTINVPKGAATENKIAGAASHLLSRLPLVGPPLTRSAQKMGAQLGQAAEEVGAMPTGSAVTPEAAGEAARKAITNYTEPKGGVLSTGVEKAYQKVNSALVPDTKITLNNTWDSVDKIRKEYKEANWTLPQSVKEVLGPLTKPGGLTYDSIRFVRTRIGEMIDDAHKLPAGISQSELRRIYGGLTEDLRAVVAKSGPQASALWERANTLARLSSERREALVGILGGDVRRSDEALFGKIMTYAGSRNTADAKLLLQARKAIPQSDWQEVVAGAVGRLGQRTTEHGSHFDPGAFVRDYGNLSENGKNVLFGQSSRVRMALDDLAKISERWPAARALAGGSTSGHGLGEMAGVVAGYHLLTQGVERGDWATPMAVLGMSAVGNGVSRLLASPVTATSAARWARTYETLRLRPNSATLAAFNNASNTLGNHLAISGEVKAEDVIKILKGAIKLPTEGKNE